MSKISAATKLKVMLGIVLSFLAYKANANNNTSHCPTEFYQLPLITSATYCQIFNQELPATLSYFAATAPNEVKTFYLDKLGQPDSDFSEKGREVMLYKAGTQIIIISSDKQGSQIDILVKQ